MRVCRVAGCCKPTSGYSNLCQQHRNTDRRHGDPEQSGVTKTELKPYIKAIQKYLDRRGGPNAGSIITKAWKSVVRKAEEELEEFSRGKAKPGFAMKACAVVSDIDKGHDATTIATNLMAMGYLFEDKPKRFVSNHGFEFQAVRVLSKLGKSTARHKWDRANSKMIRSYYPSIPKRQAAVLYGMIRETCFVGWGVSMAREDNRERELKRRDLMAERTEILGPLSLASQGTR